MNLVHFRPVEHFEPIGVTHFSNRRWQHRKNLLSLPGAGALRLVRDRVSRPGWPGKWAKWCGYLNVSPGGKNPLRGFFSLHTIFSSRVADTFSIGLEVGP